MQIYVARDGRQLGNYGEEQLRSLYERGHLLPTDFYWRDGMSEWSTLGELLPAQPVVMLEPRPAEPEEEALPGWIIPILSVGGAMFVGLLLLSLIASHYHQKMATRQVMEEMKKYVAQEQQQQRAAGGKVDPGQFSSEMKKLDDMSKSQSPGDRMLTEETVAMMREIAQRGQACRDAEAEMLDLGFTPAKLTSLEEIDKRCAAIEAAMPTLQGMIDYLSKLDASIRSDLVAKGVKPAAADSFISGMHHSGKTDALLTYWKQEAAISADLLANLDLLKKHYGEWHVDAGKIMFNDDAILEMYQGNVTKLKNDIAVQQSVQADILKSAP